MCRALLALAVIVLAMGWHSASAQPWCRVDDPAGFIAARAKLPVDKQGDVGAVPCAPIADPQTMPEEIALPMPCGHFMLFRRVTIPMSHALDQQVGYFGLSKAEGDSGGALDAVEDGPWTGHVAGSFSTPGKPGQRVYYIGKYPVAAHQARLAETDLMQPDGGRLSATDPACASYNASLGTVRERSVLPATGVSWFDAVTFAQRYTEWLLSVDLARRQAGKPPNLPWERGNTGFLRLPTESEWDFAARGGEVSADRQNQPWYRVRDRETNQVREANSIEEIAQTTSRDGKPVGVGGKAPNLLGLYDMIGNQWQIMFDMFRPIRPDGTLQANPGGFVVRGGSVRGTIGIADRRERENFIDGMPNRGDPTVGFRLVIAAPVVVSDGTWRHQQATSNDIEAAITQGRKALLSVASLPDAAPRRALDANLGALSKANAELAEATRRGEAETERARGLEQEVAGVRKQLAQLQQQEAARPGEEAARAQRQKEDAALAQRQQDDAAHTLADLEQQLRVERARTAAVQQKSAADTERVRAVEQEAARVRTQLAQLQQEAATRPREDAIRAQRQQDDTVRAQRQHDAAARTLADLEQQLSAQQARTAAVQQQSDQKIAEALTGSQTRVTEMRQALDRSTAALNQTQAELADELVFTAVTLARNVYGLGHLNYTSKKAFLPLIPRMRSSRDTAFSNPDARRSLDLLLSETEQTIPSVEQSINATFDQYLSTVLRLSRFPRDTIDTAFARADQRLRDAQGRSSDTLLIVQRHVNQAVAAGGTIGLRTRAAWIDEVDDLREARLR